MSLRSKLKFRAWESEALNATLELVLWQKAGIDQICVEHNKLPYELGDISIDPEVLYKILTGFEALSDKLMEYELLHCGYPKHTFNTH